MVTTANLTAKFEQSFSYQGELRFNGERVNVIESDISFGNVGVLPHVKRLGWDFEFVAGTFAAQGCELESLEGAPPYIGNELYIRNCKHLVTLGTSLDFVGGDMNIAGTALTSLKGGPKTVNGKVILFENPNLVSLEGFPERGVDRVEVDYSPTLPLLRLLVAKNIWLITPQIKDAGKWPIEKVEKILDKYAGRGREGAWDCKRELQQAGFGGNARW